MASKFYLKSFRWLNVRNNFNAIPQLLKFHRFNIGKLIKHDQRFFSEHLTCKLFKKLETLRFAKPPYVEPVVLLAGTFYLLDKLDVAWVGWHQHLPLQVDLQNSWLELPDKLLHSSSWARGDLILRLGEPNNALVRAWAWVRARVRVNRLRW